MIELVYKCDLCDERTYDHSCYKVWHGAGKIVEFVGYMSSKWNETKNGRIVCNECVKVIQKMGVKS